MNIDELTGKAMAAAVAEKVMGWTLETQRGGIHGARDAAGNFHVWSDGMEMFSNYFRPDLSIAQAWEVLLYLGKRHYPSLQWCESGNWRCTLELHDGDGPRVHGVAPSAPEAICKAALKAVEAANA